MDHARSAGAVRRLVLTRQASFRFAGRSSRSELLNYVLCVVFFHLAVGFVLMLGAAYPVLAAVQDCLQVAYFIQVPALVARRLHDHDRSAVWLWLVLPGVLIWVFRKALAIMEQGALRAVFDQYTWPFDLIAGLANLALIIALTLPGTAGPNRFGPDPRQP